MPSGGHKRTAKQCRTHWDRLKREVAKFGELHSKARSTFTSGYSDDMIMEKTREWCKSRNKQKPFTFEDERDSYGIPDDNTYEQSQVSAQIIGLAQGPIHGLA